MSAPHATIRRRAPWRGSAQLAPTRSSARRDDALRLARHGGDPVNHATARRGRRARERWISAVRRGWVVIVVAVVVVVAALAVTRLHGAFGSTDVTATPGGRADAATPFNPKRLVIEVFGQPGATATITYLDVDAQPQRVDDAALPWTYDATTTLPAVFANVQAQGDGASLGCRITINDERRDERVVTTRNAYTYCLDKSG